MNLGPSRQSTSRRDELLSGNLFVRDDVQQGGSELAFDWRQHSDVSHASKLRRSLRERLYGEREQYMQIGKPLRTIVVEPLETPVQQPAVEPEPSHESEPQPAEAPVAQ